MQMNSLAGGRKTCEQRTSSTPILSGGVPTEDRHTGERALTAMDLVASAANDVRPISRMSCYASGPRNAINFFEA
jgi:hypothetical protein